MTRFAATLARAVVAGALGGTLLAWLVASILSIAGAEHARRAMLDASSVVVRDALANADAANVSAWLGAKKETLAAWNVDAAAFDASGRFVAGESSLSGDGLPIGRELSPAGARQVAVVPTLDGYVLLEPSARAVGRLRVALVLWLLATLLLVGLVAYGVGRMWARERSRSLARLYAHLAAIAAGERPAQRPIDDDPAFGEFSNATGAAVDRLVRELDSRAAREDRLRTFLGEAGHELRTPLAIAVGYVGILKRGAIGDPELADRIVADISTEHERLQRLVERILHLARLDAVPAAEGEACDPARVVDEAISLVRPLDPEQRFDVDARANGYAAIASEDLRDALRNVLENALRYAPGASISVSITAATGEVRVRVTDTGPGMDAFTAEHAFDRFFRGTDRGSIPGTGLGLAIVRRIVERADGTVSLESAPGKGTTVELRIPRAKPSE